MIKFSKRLLSVILVLALMMAMSATAFAKSPVLKDKIVVDGYTFTAELNTPYMTAVSYVDEDGSKYLMTFDKVTRAIELEVMDAATVQGRTLASVSTSEKYSVNVEDADPVAGVVSGISFSSEGQAKSDDTMSPNFAFLIPLGIPIAEALVQALLALALAYVIGGVAWIVISEAAAAIKSQNTYQYYAAEIRYDQLLVGPAIPIAQARLELSFNTWYSGVIATNQANALALLATCGGGFWDPPHGGADYLPHYHPNLYTASHLWYLV